MRHPKTNLTKRCGVKGFIPPQTMLDIASDRTDCLLEAYYMDAFRGRSFEDAHKALQVLVRSAYMQGVHDMIEAAGSARFGAEK